MSSSTPRGRPRKLPVDGQRALVLNAAAHMFAFVAATRTRFRCSGKPSGRAIPR
jgi:hypothetical protein